MAMGEPKHAQHYCGKLSPSVNCLTQEDAAPYFAYGLSQAGMKELMGLKTIRAGMDAAAEGFLPQQPIGDPRMMPGSFLVDRDGIVRWTYYGTDVSDHPQVAEIVATAREMRAPAR